MVHRRWGCFSRTRGGHWPKYLAVFPLLCRRPSGAAPSRWTGRQGEGQRGRPHGQPACRREKEGRGAPQGGAGCRRGKEGGRGAEERGRAPQGRKACRRGEEGGRR